MNLKTILFTFGLSLIIVCLIILNPITAFANPTPTPAQPTPTPSKLVSLPSDLQEGTEIICAETGLKLRESPTTREDNILAILRKNDNLIFLGWENSAWVYVEYEDTILGYCSSRYLLYNSAAIPTATPAPTVEPTPSPTVAPTTAPTVEPTTAPTVEPIDTPKPTITNKEAPLASATGYINEWENNSIGKKLSRIPSWLFFAIPLGVLLVIIYIILLKNNRRHK